jgi:hypothetical protein
VTSSLAKKAPRGSKNSFISKYFLKCLLIGVHGNKNQMMCACVHVCVRERERERERDSHVWMTRWHFYLEHCLSTAGPPTAAGPQILTNFINVYGKQAALIFLTNEKYCGKRN